MNNTALIKTDAPWWDDRDKLDLIKRTLCPVGIPDGDFAVCMEKCRRLDMDPLSGEVFIIKRNQNVGSKQSPNWVAKYEVQVAETGMARRAEGFPDYRGMLGGVVYAGDDILIDNATGQVVKHLSNPLKAGEVKGAWAVCKRDGKVFPVEFVWLHEMRQDTGQWGKAAVMIYKCARSAALRRAFPEAFSGTYSKEEMLVHGATKESDYVAPQLPLPQTAPALPPPTDAIQVKAEALLERVEASQGPSIPILDHDPDTGEVVGEPDIEDVTADMTETEYWQAKLRAEKTRSAALGVMNKAPDSVKAALSATYNEKWAARAHR